MERDNFLTEAMGECWHVVEFDGKCYKCFSFIGMCVDRIDFSTWEGFGKLWGWVIEQVWWDEFFLDHSVSAYTPHKVWRRSQVKELTNPDRFANAVYEFLKERT